MELIGNMFYAASKTGGSSKSSEWYIDNGCSNHMTGNINLLIDVKRNLFRRVQMPDETLENIVGKCTLVIDTNKGKRHIKEVLYLPSLKENLLSVGLMDEHGHFLIFGDGMCHVYDGPTLENLVLKVKAKKNRCYPLTMTSSEQIALRVQAKFSVETWCKRMGHLHLNALLELKRKEMVLGLPKLGEMMKVCEGCQFGK
ncbi:uncharacterized protein LOC107425716 [Ziziphus jujuba]|uniref:Uncharacterized protein LOC107425716 n=1 Tax=Ziziphus jujuba TaxID=326968 RepID=A0A6P4A6G8_ZIZJJ|nr:uncharacterized protein LOC107425716 [Ziziphus jujuba]